MKYTPLSIDVNLRPEGFVVHVDSLFAALARLSDRRDARGLRYALVTVLVHLGINVPAVTRPMPCLCRSI